MKTATQIAQAHPDVVEAQQVAESTATACDQIWGGDGYTKYVFSDNSVLIQSGVRQYAMDADDAVSINGYAAWLGDDVEHEQAEIDRLLDALN